MATISQKTIEQIVADMTGTDEPVTGTGLLVDEYGMTLDDACEICTHIEWIGGPEIDPDALAELYPQPGTQSVILTVRDLADFVETRAMEFA